jgi:hypothetical protein
MTDLAKKAGCDLAPDFTLPSWLDRFPCVVDQVVRIYNRIVWQEREYGQRARFGHISEKEVLKRLATDPRMQRVWTELYRRQRKSNKFVHSVKRFFQRDFRQLEFPEIAAALTKAFATLSGAEQQDMAVGHFLEAAWFFAATPLPLMTEDRINSQVKSYRRMASQLRKDAEGLRALHLGNDAANLESAAIRCEQIADQVRPTHEEIRWLLPIAARRRGDEIMRGYVLRVSAHCHDAFGKWLTGTVATAASVALSKKITEDAVRAIVRAHRPRR